MNIRSRLSMLLLPLLLAATAGLALAKPPPWAPAHGYRAQHRYVYYPNGEIYYAPDSHMWFWLSGSGWQAGISLPLALRAYVRVGGVDIQLDASRPYQRHDYVVRRYGGHRVRWKKHDHGDRGRGHRERGHHGHHGRD